MESFCLLSYLSIHSFVGVIFEIFVSQKLGLPASSKPMETVFVSGEKNQNSLRLIAGAPLPWFEVTQTVIRVLVRARTCR